MDDGCATLRELGRAGSKEAALVVQDLRVQHQKLAVQKVDDTIALLETELSPVVEWLGTEVALTHEARHLEGVALGTDSNLVVGGWLGVGEASMVLMFECVDVESHSGF